MTNTLSTGHPNTLKSWLELCTIFMGEDSKATAFVQKKINESPNGENEEVLADEGQFLYVLSQIHLGVTNE